MAAVSYTHLIHPAGFEQHFPALFGHQVAIRAAAIAQRYREILFDPVSYTHLDVYKRQP